MKQHISVKDLESLTDSQKERLRVWWKPEPSDHFTNGNGEAFYVGSIMRKPGVFITYGDDIPHGKDGLLPLLSIGQMIEFLRDHYNTQQWTLGDIVVDIDTYKPDELCDALWDAVKKVI